MIWEFYDSRSSLLHTGRLKLNRLTLSLKLRSLTIGWGSTTFESVQSYQSLVITVIELPQLHLFDYNFLPKYAKSLEITNAFKNLISALKPVWNHNARFLERSFKTLIRSLTKIRSIDNLKCLHDIYYYLSYFGYDFMNRLYFRW